MGVIGQAGWVSELVWTQRPEEKSFASARDHTPVIRTANIITDTEK
jgi:hypothetical protein